MRLHAISCIIFSIIVSDIEAIYSIPPNCTKVTSVTVPKFVPYEETYRYKNWLGIYRWKTRQNYRYENRVMFNRETVCCSGYLNVSNVCVPICSNDCEHGDCIAPEICVCAPGYTNEHNECVPICTETCVHGSCTAPDICSCHDGYQLLPDGFTCVPVCHGCENLEYCVEPHVCRCLLGYERAENDRVDSDEYRECRPRCDYECANADCVEPNVCKCKPGYEDIDGDVYNCEPICHSDCRYGVCVEPDVCLCWPGFKNYGRGVCEPVCDDPCVNAVCVAPEVCSCNDGYYQTDDSQKNHVCEPYCGGPASCEHGHCVAPEVCACEPGYRPINNETGCEPVCTEACYQGECTLPEHCSCFDGYRLSNGSLYTCEPICSQECVNGQCTAPEECTCDDGYEMKNSTDVAKCIVVCECENGFCNETSSACETCEEGYDLSLELNSTLCKPRCEGGCSGHGQCYEPQKCECEGYYRPDNDTLGNPVCVHACGADCAHGVCSVERAKCECFYGWAGKYCDESTICAVSVSGEPAYLQLNETTDFGEEENKTMEERWSGPSCSKLCLREINRDTIKCVNQSVGEESEILCFLRIDSQCNVHSVVQSRVSKDKGINLVIVEYSTVTISILVILAIAAVIFIRKRRKALDIELSNPNQHAQKPEEDCLIENEDDGVSL